MTKQLLIDGDWITYTAGFAGQKTQYVLPDTIPGRVFEKGMTEVNEYMKENGLKEKGRVFSYIEVDELSHVLHSAKLMLETQLEAAQQRFPDDDILPTVYVDGSGNFRDRIATIRPYKGNRVQAKPVLWAEIREYLVDNWDAETVYDQESDDQMAIDQTACHEEHGMGSSIICAVDKDMLQVPGYHLNPNKGWKKITHAEGLWRLYVQAAQGDTTDNIAGAYKVGPIAAKKMFETLRGSVDECAYWERLCDIYAETIDKYGPDIYNHLTASEAALENMRLVYLRRQDNEIWLPPTQRS